MERLIFSSRLHFASFERKYAKMLMFATGVALLKKAPLRPKEDLLESLNGGCRKIAYSSYRSRKNTERPLPLSHFSIFIVNQTASRAISLIPVTSNVRHSVPWCWWKLLSKKEFICDLFSFMRKREKEFVLLMQASRGIYTLVENRDTLLVIISHRVRGTNTATIEAESCDMTPWWEQVSLWSWMPVRLWARGVEETTLSQHDLPFSSNDLYGVPLVFGSKYNCLRKCNTLASPQQDRKSMVEGDVLMYNTCTLNAWHVAVTRLHCISFTLANHWFILDCTYLIGMFCMKLGALDGAVAPETLQTYRLKDRKRDNMHALCRAVTATYKLLNY